jgi:hypothetical protein
MRKGYDRRHHGRPCVILAELERVAEVEMDHIRPRSDQVLQT